MLDIFSRHRPLALLAGVVLAQILLLAFQIKRERDVRLIRYWAVELMTPVERGGTWGISTIRGVWTGYIDLRNARVENRQLRDEIGQLELRNRELQSEANEAQRLQVMLNFRDTHPEAQTLAAQVIGASADPVSHTLFINRGARDHLRNNMAVVTPDGIVGKLIEVFPAASQVLLINDRDSGVGALFAESRTHGVVKGSGDPNPRMDYIINDEKVKIGESVLTSGDDRIFPKGLLIGTVADMKAALPFQIIHVQPAARLDRLEDVLVLLVQQPLEPKNIGDSSPAYSLVPASPPASVKVGSGAIPSSTQLKPAPAANIVPARPSPDAKKPSRNARKPSATLNSAPAAKPVAPRE